MVYLIVVFMDSCQGGDLIDKPTEHAIDLDMLMRQPITVQFSNHPKMSLRLVELRINNHLNRIMKNHRLMNFCNAVKQLPVESRVCEKLIEIMNSCQALIERKMPLIKEAKDVLKDLRQIHHHGNSNCNCFPSLMDLGDDFNVSCHQSHQQQPQHPPNVDNDPRTATASLINRRKKDMMLMEAFYERIKQVCSNTEQIVWALNSNKEHLRYIAKVMVVPEVYSRGNDVINQPNNDDYDSIWLRSKLISVVHHCETIIQICKLIRNSIASLMKDIYSAVDTPLMISADVNHLHKDNHKHNNFELVDLIFNSD